MKKSKFLIYAAVAATAAIVSSCSNEDVVEQTPQKGRPIVVEASVDGDSRASVATSFTGFKLYGYDQANEGAQFLNGVGFANSGTAWTSVGAANWPEGSGKSDFYAISVQGAAPATLPTAFDITDLSSGSFDYTVPANVADQQDILVAKHTDVSYADNAGKIKLGFKHALANVTMQVRFNRKENGENTTTSMREGEILTFNKIIFHNVYTSGTYNASTGVWTPTGEKGDVVINFAEAPSYRSDVNYNSVAYQDLKDGDAIFGQSVMFVPQTPDAYWTPSENHGISEATGKPYIEIVGLTYTTSAATPKSPLNYTSAELEQFLNDLIENETEMPFNIEYGDNIDENVGEEEIPAEVERLSNSKFATSFYIPLPNGFSFSFNKNYNLRLNVANAFRADGKKVYTGTNFVTQ